LLISDAYGFDKPSCQIAARLGEIAAIVQPAQLLQAVIVDPAWHAASLRIFRPWPSRGNRKWANKSRTSGPV
jgi:hypothetical protein